MGLMNKLLFIFGTRPEAIKMAPVILELRSRDEFDVKVCVTGQHREMLDTVLNLFNIEPDFDLNIMKANQTLSGITSNILIGLENVITDLTPDCILVHGDTSTTMASSIAAYYHKVPVFHIEAGLRTGDKYSPWPEEINRKIAGAISDVHFCPTAVSKENLLKENVPEHQIHITGNTVIDALLHTVSRIDSDTALRGELESKFSYLDKSKKLLLVTGHRRESFGLGFKNICDALAQLSARKDIQIVYPMHPNPNVQEPVTSALSEFSNIHLVSPLDYLPFVHLMNKAAIILTDSGGVQEEAPSLGTPVLVMRDKTERPEGIEAGTVKLVGTNTQIITETVSSLLDDEIAYNEMSRTNNPYGDGTASRKIAETLLHIFKSSQAA